MPSAVSESGRVSPLNCGVVRERGIERTSTSIVMSDCCRSATNSAKDRVEWPIVRIVALARLALELAGVVGVGLLDPLPCVTRRELGIIPGKILRVLCQFPFVAQAGL